MGKCMNSSSMQRQHSSTTNAPDWSLLQDVVSMFDVAAAVVADDNAIVVCNTAWAQLGEFPLPADAPRSPVMEVRERVKPARGADHAGEPDDGAPEAPLPPSRMTSMSCAIQAAQDHGFSIERRDLRSSGWGLALTLVVLRPPAQHFVVADGRQRVIDLLLIRQTLIEESERRRVGLALHDVVAQDMVYVRSRVIELGLDPVVAAHLIETIDRVIDEVRTLTFDLSPPILEDLGLGPALHWLAEHVAGRYSVNVAMTHNGITPKLTQKKRVIVFRAVRELLINAAKHAAGSEIIVTLIVSKRVMRIMVLDTGPGFDIERIRAAMHEGTSYGLLSVEQQIRGIGGKLHLTSSPGDGTKAIITVPLDHGTEHDHE